MHACLTFWSFSLERCPNKASEYPSFANWMAAAPPIPPDAPVMTAVFFIFMPRFFFLF
jgi:hypothetical protein